MTTTHVTTLVWIISAGAGVFLHIRGRHTAVVNRDALAAEGINGSARAMARAALMSESIRLFANSLALIAGLAYLVTRPPAPTGSMTLRFWIVRVLLFAFLWAFDFESFYSQRLQAAVVEHALELKRTQRRRADDQTAEPAC